jgi:predicted Zn-dependent protease
MSSSEKKKQARKAKKAEQQKIANAAKNPVETGKKVDDDPEGVKLVTDLTPAQFLEEAVKFLGPLQAFAPEDIRAWIYGVELYTRQGKMLLAWRSLKKAVAIDPTHPLVYQQLFKFYQMGMDFDA